MIVRELLTVLGVKVEGKGFEDAEKRFEGLKANVTKVMQFVGASLVANKIKTTLQDVAAEGDRLDELSARMGITTDALQELEYAAKLSGIESNELARSLDVVRRNAFAAANGNVQASRMFDRLGVQVRDTSGALRGSDELLSAVAAGLDQVANETERTAILQGVFGRGASRLLPLLKNGTAGLAALRKEAHTLGGVMSRELIQKSVEFSDQQDRLNMAFTGLRNNVFGPLLEGATKVVGLLTDLSRSLIGIVQNSNLAQAAFATIGTALAIYFAPAILTALAVTAAFLAIILVVDDVWTAIEGGDSLIGDLLVDFQRWINDVSAADFSGSPWMQALQKAVQMVKWLQETFSSKTVDMGTHMEAPLPQGNWFSDMIGMSESPGDRAYRLAEEQLASERRQRAALVAGANVTSYGASGFDHPIPNQSWSSKVDIVVNGAAEPGRVAEEVMSRLEDWHAGEATKVLGALTPRAP